MYGKCTRNHTCVESVLETVLVRKENENKLESSVALAFSIPSSASRTTENRKFGAQTDKDINKD